MSTHDTSEPGWIDTVESPLEEPPTFELTFAYDDEDDPSTVTIHPEGSTDRTTWISIDAENAVSTADAR
jgi:hypothetical protein